MAAFERFDICEAYFVIEVEYNVGGWLHERPSNRRRREATHVQLHRMKFQPRPTLEYKTLSENAKEIYNGLCERYGFPRADEKWYVTYKVQGKAYEAGPYDSDDEADTHRLDIAGYEGVTDVKVVHRMPKDPDAVLASLKEKLHPRRFSNPSGRWMAIIGYLLGEHYTEPAIDDMAVTTDGFVLAQHEGDVGLNDFFGDVADLDRNWRNYITAAELDGDERAEAGRLFKEKVRRA